MSLRFFAFTRTRFALTVASAVMVAHTAHAQQTTPPTSTPAAPFVAGWQDGFALQSPNSDYRLGFGFVGQTDGRFDLDTPASTTSTFALRKLRPILAGRIARYFDYRFMPDFGNGTTTVMDAYLDVRFSTRFRLRTGKDKTPVGYELLIADASLFFPERSLASLLVANRDIGIQAQGDLAGGKLTYAGGVFNGIPDVTSTNTDTDTNAGKDIAGRLVVQPFRDARTPSGAPNGLGFQLAGSTGHQVGSLPIYKTSMGQTFFSYTGATAGGAHHRIAPTVFYYRNSLGVFAEYIQSTEGVVNVKSGAAQSFTNRGWNLTGEYHLTGETATISVPRPRHAFDPQTGAFGALTLVARYSEIRVDRSAFASGDVSTGSSRRAQQYTVGVNWLPVSYVKYYIDYERTVFDGNPHGARKAENVVFLRVQLAF